MSIIVRFCLSKLFLIAGSAGDRGVVLSWWEPFIQIPDNKALEGLAGALIKAWRLYKQPKSVILFLVEDVSYNVCDQKFHEFEIRKQCPEVFVIRKTLTEIGKRGKLTEVTINKKIQINPQSMG